MSNKPIIKVGDTVMWRGCFGRDAAVPAKIEQMEMTEQPRTKYGVEVRAAFWDDKDYLLVTLDNGHWAYGEQLSPLPAGVAA